MRYLLPPTAGAEMKGIPGLLHFDEQLALPSTVYLFDCGGMNQLEPPRCAAITIVVSSPDPSHYGDWVKAKPVFTMPVWSAEECAAVVPAIYPARPLPDGTDESAARFKLHGGIARTIFSQETSATLQAQLEEAITACNLPAVVGSIDLSQKLPGATHRLLHYAVDETNYRSRTLIFATDDICERVMEKQEKEHSNDVVSFLIGAAGRKDIAGVRGKVFELHAHAVLPLGGEFKARWEDDEKHEELWMQFNASNRKGVVKDLSVLADRVSRSCHPSHSLNWQCRKCSRIITRGAHMTLTCVRVRVCVMFQEYARLLKPNYPVIDAALRPKHLFQMTVSETHSINVKWLHQIRTELGLEQTPCILYVVVPWDIYPTFQNPSILPSGESLPDDVRVMVMELPLKLREVPLKQQEAQPTASADPAVVTTIGGKRKVIHTRVVASAALGLPCFLTSVCLLFAQLFFADTVDLPAKRPAITACQCDSGCASLHCRCKNSGNPCGTLCHTKAPTTACING